MQIARTVDRSCAVALNRGFALLTTKEQKEAIRNRAICRQPHGRTAEGAHRPVTPKDVQIMASLLLCRPDVVTPAACTNVDTAHGTLVRPSTPSFFTSPGPFDGERQPQ